VLTSHLIVPHVPGDAETQLNTGHCGVILSGLQVISQLPVLMPGFESQLYLVRKTCCVHTHTQNNV